MEQDDREGMCSTVEQTILPGSVTMPIISLLNLKGGVGKTSTCHHLAGVFAKAGLRTYPR